MKKIKVFTAFSGYDSQCMALDRLCCDYPELDYGLVGWSEIDTYAIASHNAAFPQYADRNYGDISKICWKYIEPIDIFTYSSPCTDFSMAGVRKGGEEGSGTASSLLWECRRAIATMRPPICIFENVKAVIDQTMDPTFMKWEMTMCDMGYRNYWRIMNAADYGVPQHRERIIMVSLLDSYSSEKFVFPSPVSLSKNAEDILEDAEEELYLPQHSAEDYLKRLGDEYATQHSTYDARSSTKCIARFITPTCKGGMIPTLTAAGTSTRPKNMISTQNRPNPGVVEIYGLHDRVIPCLNDPANRNEFFKELKSNEYVRIRNLSARERLRAMGVSEKYIRRLISPREELSEMGYSKTEIDNLLTVNGRLIKNSHRSVGKQAGNSIVVDVLYHVFRQLLIHR